MMIWEFDFDRVSRAFRQRSINALACLGVLWPGTSAVLANSAGSQDVLVIFDSSASMSERTSRGEVKIDVAKRTLAEFVSRLSEFPSDLNVGLIAYGHRTPANQPNSCRDIELVVPVDGVDSGLLWREIQDFRPTGNTPIASSLRLAAEALAELNRDTEKVVILVTDGAETCGGDPLREADRFRQQGVQVKFFVIGVDLPAGEVRAVEAIAAAGGGQFLSARNAEDLMRAFRVIETKTLAPELSPATVRREAYFVDEFDGGELSNHWEVLNPDADSYIVEDETMLVVNGTPSTLAKGNVPNLFLLNQPLPDGDWQATVRLQLEVQTFLEQVSFGLYEDKDNFLAATARANKNGFPLAFLDVSAAKNSQGKTTSFSARLLEGSKGAPIAKQAKEISQPILIRLSKRGRSYIVSARLDNGLSSEWVTLEKLTMLRAKGRLALGFGRSQQYVNNGESILHVDWIKVEQID